MTASIIAMAVCLVKKSQIASLHAIEQPAKELWLSPSTSTCAIRTFVLLNTCWWDCLSKKKEYTQTLSLQGVECRGSLHWYEWKISYITHQLNVEIDRSDLWSHCPHYSQINQDKSTGQMITNVRWRERDGLLGGSVNIGEFKTPTLLSVIQDSYVCQLSAILIW